MTYRVKFSQKVEFRLHWAKGNPFLSVDCLEAFASFRIVVRPMKIESRRRPAVFGLRLEDHWRRSRIMGEDLKSPADAGP